MATANGVGALGERADSAPHAPTTRRRRPWRRWALRSAALLYLGLGIGVPALAVVARGFGEGLGPLVSALTERGAVAALQLTLFTSAVVAAINGLFGVMLAYVLVRYRFPGRSLLASLIDLPFAIPTLVTGVMLVALYGPSGPIGQALSGLGIQVIFTPLGITLALLVVTLPLVVRAVEPVLIELEPAEEEAAQVLGASAWTTFRRIIFPALRPAVIGGMLLAFARALGEFGSVVIVAGNITGDTLTAPVYIFQLTSQFRYAEAAAVATLLFLLSAALVVATERVIMRRDEA